MSSESNEVTREYSDTTGGMPAEMCYAPKRPKRTTPHPVNPNARRPRALEFK